MRSSIYNVKRKAGETLYTCRGKVIGIQRRKHSKRKHGKCRILTQAEIRKIYG